MSAWHEILPPMRRARRRMRLQAALELATVLAVPAIVAVIAAVYLYKVHVVHARALVLVVLGAAALVALGGVLGALGRIPLRRAARALDRAGGLSDRLGSALEFGPEAADPYMHAAIADATRHLGRADPRRAAPFRPPLALPGLAVALLALLLLLPLRIPARGVAVVPTPPRAPTLAVDAEDLVAERELSRALEREAARNDDQQLGDLARELARLLDDLEAGRLTHKEVFEKLAELEQKFAAGLEGDFEPVLKDLRKLGAELAKEKPTAELGRALKEDELALAKEELDTIAERLKAQQKQDAKEQAALAKALERAGAGLDKRREEEKDAKAREGLEREKKRLEREQEKNPSREDVKRRLEQKKRELEKLSRDQQRRQEQRRQLERLARDMQQAGQQAGAGQKQQAADSAQRAGQQMQRFAGEQRRSKAGQKLGGQLSDLKEMLRRMGNGQQRGDQQQQQAQQGKSGKGQQGKPGQQGQKQGKKAEFYSRAKGEPKPGDLVVPEEGGDGKMQLPGQGQPGDQPGDQPGNQPGPPQAGEGPDTPRGRAGDGIGSSHDPNLLGEKTRLRARHRDVLAPGKEGAGPNRAETILSASERGFATRSYKRVYRDYTSVAEEVMNREKVPLGFKYYVKRYFRLIMPRE
ncbi:MAG TPA: hypothetical protein VGQ83_00695 [Polyangia bacterium]|jgi:hypothetical protein